MLDSYINNIENIVSDTLFIGFKITLIILDIFTDNISNFTSYGDLIKSQKMKSKFLIAVPSLLIGIIFFLSIPPTFIYFKNLI